MLRIILAATAIVAAVASFAMVGCDKPKSTAPAAPAAAATDKPAASETTTDAAPDPKIAAALATLSAADRALAEKQKICPVSGEPLGVMGTPKKLDVKGQAVFICCEGCEEKLLANPDEYLAKLNK
ncbi:MAG: hypothetical protein U0805_09630 [Pirellulales bacterium]